MLRLLTLLAFLFTGPGLSGLEVVAHLAGDRGAEHARTPHFEPSGGRSHTEHCTLGLASHDGRLPASCAVRRVPVAPVRSEFHRPTPYGLSSPTTASSLPRAPPAET